MKNDKDSRLFNLYIPLFLVLIGLTWKIFYLDHRDICVDEPFTIFSAQKTIGEIINITREGEPNPPLFMILLHYWIKIFGISSYSVRFLPLLFNVFTVLFIYLIGKRYISFWGGLIASGIFLLSNYHFFHALETRTYSLVYLETAAALYFFLRYTENQKDRKALAGLIISNLLLVYSHYFGWFVILSQAICSILYVKDLKAYFRFLIPAGATVIGFTPMIPIIIKQYLSKTTHGTWLTPPKAYNYLDELYFFFNHKDVFWFIITIIGIGIVFTSIFLILKKSKGFDIIIPVLLLWWIIPYTFMFFVSFKVPMFNNRYVLFNSIGLYLTVGALINFLYQKNKYFVPATGMLVLIFMLDYINFLPNDFAYREVKKSVDFVKSAENENSIIILYPYWSSFQFAYYYDPEIFTDHKNYDDRLKKNGIYRVWGVPNTKYVVEANPGKRVIYLQDEKIMNNEGNIFKFLDSAYVKRDSVHFLQNFNIGVYDPKPGK
jgi:mannosyltransferase